MSDSVRPQRRQPTRLPRPWDSPGKNTGVGCHFLLQCMKVKRESEVAQSCPTLNDPMDCSLPGSSIHGIFQARVLEWVAIAFSDICCWWPTNRVLIITTIIVTQYLFIDYFICAQEAPRTLYATFLIYTNNPLRLILYSLFRKLRDWKRLSVLL